MVVSMSAGEWAADMNPASKADGAKYTPSSSMRWKNRLKRSMSQAITFAKLSTRRSAVKKIAEHPADVVGGEGNAAARGRTGEPLHEQIGARVQPLVKARHCDEIQSGQPGRHGDRVSRKSPRLVNGSQGRELLHDVAPSAERAHRHAAADDFAERGEVGTYSVKCLRAAQGDAKPGHHLVEYQQRADPIAFLAQRPEEARRGRTQFMLPATGSTMTQAIWRSELAKGIAHLVGVVEGRGDRVLRQLAWARRARWVRRRSARPIRP